MKNLNHLKYYCLLFFISCILLSGLDVAAQICVNQKDSVYGLTTTGQIVAINVNNGGGSTIGSPAAGAVNSNAIGYSNVTGLFYFFNKNGGAVQEFVSFNPMTSALVPLAASPIAAAHTIRSGS